MEYLDQLIENCEAAKKANPIDEFVLLNSSEESLAKLDDIKIAIYIIREIGGDAGATFVSLAKFKTESDRKCPKLNSPSGVMYVGSSTTGLQKRINEHFGDGHKATYALNLGHWFKGDFEVSIRVYNKPPKVIQLIEDALAYDLQPAFGKRGSNNK